MDERINPNAKGSKPGCKETARCRPENPRDGTAPGGAEAVPPSKGKAGDGPGPACGGRQAEGEAASASSGTPDTEEGTTPGKAEGADKGNRWIESWPVENLKPHRHQDALHQPLTEAEWGRLARSMEVDGQKDAVEVLPDGTVLDGHQRLRVAKHLGWTKVRVRVRYDLAGNELEADRLHALANQNRRQLGPLDQARLAKRLTEIEEKKPPGGLPDWKSGDLRDRVGAVMGMSGRHVTRLLNVLKAPMCVQRAVAAGTMTMVVAERIARLDAGAQREVAREIEGGADPAVVAAAHLPEKGAAGVDVDKELGAFFKAGSKALEAIGGRTKGVNLPPCTIDPGDYIKTLKRMGTMISKIVDRLEWRRKDLAKSMKAVGKLMPKGREDSRE